MRRAVLRATGWRLAARSRGIFESDCVAAQKFASIRLFSVDNRKSSAGSSASPPPKPTHFAVRYSLDAMRAAFGKLKLNDTSDAKMTPDALKAIEFCSKALRDANDSDIVEILKLVTWVLKRDFVQSKYGAGLRVICPPWGDLVEKVAQRVAALENPADLFACLEPLSSLRYRDEAFAKRVATLCIQRFESVRELVRFLFVANVDLETPLLEDLTYAVTELYRSSNSEGIVRSTPNSLSTFRHLAALQARRPTSMLLSEANYDLLHASVSDLGYFEQFLSTPLSRQRKGSKHSSRPFDQHLAQARDDFSAIVDLVEIEACARPEATLAYFEKCPVDFDGDKAARTKILAEARKARRKGVQLPSRFETDVEEVLRFTTRASFKHAEGEYYKPDFSFTNSSNEAVALELFGPSHYCWHDPADPGAKLRLEGATLLQMTRATRRFGSTSFCLHDELPVPDTWFANIIAIDYMSWRRVTDLTERSNMIRGCLKSLSVS